MKRQILAITVGIALTAAVLTPALSSNNQAFAQVTAESRVLQAILGLTDQIKQQTIEIKGKYDDTIFDLNLKKKFYEHEISVEGSFDSFQVFVDACPNGDDGACAFNVESIQIDCANNPVPVTSIVVDGVPTDISDKGITTPTNLLVDTSIGKIGANEFVLVNLGTECSNGEAIISGEKPQGMDLLVGIASGT